MLERGILTMNGARAIRQQSPPSEDLSEGSELLSNPSYDIMTEDVSRFTTQYYTTVEAQSSPQLLDHSLEGKERCSSSPQLLDPSLEGKERSSSSGSSTSGGSKSTSTSSDEGAATLSQDSPSPSKQGAFASLCDTAILNQDSPSPSKQASSSICDPGSPVRSICTTLTSNTTVGGSDSSSVKHWSYEEQFKQLYNLSEDPERKEFLDKLFDYMQKKGSPITRVPIMAKQPLDLYRLFQLVVERGGLVEVIKKKAWRAVAKELNLPASITSAAFTMRSQYVKYLYPYECEVEKLSDPQELQMAIDSNKRDRRHSETVDFIPQPITPCRSELESLSPATQAVTTPQGFQILNSPVALPHGSIPPYSGGFIVTQGPGGTQISGPPQLVQMAAHPHGIPVMVPAAIATPKHERSRSAASDEKEEVRSRASSEASDREPPAKRLALDSGRTIITSMGKVCTISPSGYVMTPSGHMVPTSHFNAHGSHVVQMGAHPNIPLVMSATAASSYPSKTSPVETHAGGGKILREDIHRRSPLENGLSPSYSLSGAGKQRVQILPASHLLQMAPPSHMPLVVPAMPVSESSNRDPHGRQSEQRQSSGDPSMTPKMPFANISIQSANKEGDSSDSSTLLVTLEINNTVFQGVLFAKPSSISPSR